MRRTCFGSMAALSLLVAAPQAHATSLAFEDNKLNFITCDGRSVTARWRDQQISLSEPGKSLGDEHREVKFKAWNGECRAFRWDRDRGAFVIKDGSSEAKTGLIRYVAPDGTKWVGTRAGDGFFVTKIAAADEHPTAERIQDVAAWLARTSREFTPGAELAEHLKSAKADEVH